jgi:hypothetical protein
MATRLWATISVLLLVWPALTSAALDFQQGSGAAAAKEEAAALAAFEQSVQDYVAIQRRLARRTPALQVTADAARVRAAIASLGQAIRRERAGARRGEVFTAPVAAVFQRRINAALRNFDVVALKQEIDEDNEAGLPKLVVNGPFPWNSGNAIWPSMLAVLPRLPEGLEYRFVGTDLVLVDLRSDLVIDILEGALK